MVEVRGLRGVDAHLGEGLVPTANRGDPLRKVARPRHDHAADRFGRRQHVQQLDIGDADQRQQVLRVVVDDDIADGVVLRLLDLSAREHEVGVARKLVQLPPALEEGLGEPLHVADEHHRVAVGPKDLQGANGAGAGPGVVLEAGAVLEVEALGFFVVALRELGQLPGTGTAREFLANAVLAVEVERRDLDVGHLARNAVESQKRVGDNLVQVNTDRERLGHLMPSCLCSAIRSKRSVAYLGAYRRLRYSLGMSK